MTPAYAADIVTWRYPAPFDCYDMTSADSAFLACPASGMYALTDATGLPAAFRMTIASFSIRSQRVVQSLGFRVIGRFQALSEGEGYELLIRPEPAAAQARPHRQRDHRR